MPLVSTQARHIELPASVCGVGVGDGDGFQHVDDLGSQQHLTRAQTACRGKEATCMAEEFGAYVSCV